MNRSVLFVSHDSVRAGAVLSLLNFLRWFKSNADIPFQVLICERGEMDRAFEEMAPVWYLDPGIGRKARLRTALRALMIGRDAARTAGYSDLASRVGSGNPVGLVFSNTVLNGRVLEALSPLRSPVLTHVHELEFAIQARAGEDFDAVKRHTNRYVAVSDAVRRNLVDRHGISVDRIECIRGAIETTARPRSHAAALKQSLAAEIGIRPDSKIVGGCGVAYWLKGPDLFLQLAVAIRARAPHAPVHLVWLGAAPQGRELLALKHDLARTGLANSVHFIGARSNPLDYIAAFDVHALVSREESLSLVTLEAAASGLPTVCFDDAGGACEFVETDAGASVPYLDVGAMADRVLELLFNDRLRAELGRRAREKVLERHDIGQAAPKLLRTIQGMLQSSPKV